MKYFLKKLSKAILNTVTDELIRLREIESNKQLEALKMAAFGYEKDHTHIYPVQEDTRRPCFTPSENYEVIISENDKILDVFKMQGQDFDLVNKIIESVALNQDVYIYKLKDVENSAFDFFSKYPISNAKIHIESTGD